MSWLTKKEFFTVTETWIERLSDSMSSASCNDVCPDEFPQSVCGKFNCDSDVLEAWEKMFKEKVKDL